MKKFLTLFLVCLLCFSLVACSSQPTYIPPSSDSSSSSVEDGGEKSKDEGTKDKDDDEDEDVGGKTAKPGDILSLDDIDFDKIDDEVKANKIPHKGDLSVASGDVFLTGYTLAQETIGDKTEYYAFLFFDFSNKLDKETSFYHGSLDFYQNGVSLSNYHFEGDGFTNIKKDAKVDFIVKATLRDLTTDIDIEVMRYSAGYEQLTSKYTLPIK